LTLRAINGLPSHRIVFQEDTMDDKNCNDNGKSITAGPGKTAATQKIIVFQQNGSGEKKIAGIRKHHGNLFDLEIVSIDAPLPPVIDDAREHLPREIQADLVLDFLKHPDLSHDLAEMCRKKNIPVVASGKKSRGRGVLTPPT